MTCVLSWQAAQQQLSVNGKRPAPVGLIKLLHFKWDLGQRGVSRGGALQPRLKAGGFEHFVFMAFGVWLLKVGSTSLPS